LTILAAMAISLICMADAANYIYEETSVKGVGYKSVEIIISPHYSFNGQKLVKMESCTGNIIIDETELMCVQNYRKGSMLTEMYSHVEHLQKTTKVMTSRCDNASYLMISNPENEGYPYQNVSKDGCQPCYTGVLEANLNSKVIGVAHIGWISRDPESEKNLKGKHAEYGRSVEDLTGVFSIEKFIQLWGNSTCGAISVDWLPCV